MKKKALNLQKKNTIRGLNHVLHGDDRPARHGRARVAGLVESLEQGHGLSRAQAARGREGRNSRGGRGRPILLLLLLPTTCHRGRVGPTMQPRHGPAPAKPVVGAAEQNAGRAQRAQRGCAHQARLARDDDGQACQVRAWGAAGRGVGGAQGVKGDELGVAGGLGCFGFLGVLSLWLGRKKNKHQTNKK
jgi:hypothetical protein